MNEIFKSASKTPTLNDCFELLEKIIEIEDLSRDDIVIKLYYDKSGAVEYSDGNLLCMFRTFSDLEYNLKNYLSLSKMEFYRKIISDFYKNSDENEKEQFDIIIDEFRK